MYIQLQLWIWLFFHILSLFWGVKFPFHYRSYQQSGRVKYVHVATVVVGILIPLIPAFLPFALNGYGYSIRVPPVFCVPIDISLFVYPVALPVGMLSLFSTVLFLIVFRSISKVIVITKQHFKVPTYQLFAYTSGLPPTDVRRFMRIYPSGRNIVAQWLAIATWL